MPAIRDRAWTAIVSGQSKSPISRRKPVPIKSVCSRFHANPPRPAMGYRRSGVTMPALALGLSFLCISAITHSPVAQADQVRIPVSENIARGQDQALPRLGDTQDAVAVQFGEPERRVAPVGQPPISQWHYPGFVVYFEGDRVIHAVLKKD